MMGASRKLQVEIDRIWKKVYDTDNQKEKYEADLKKLIKNLQPYKHQIKTWIESTEVKDNKISAEKALVALNHIEKEIAKFKICEKETKTKSVSEIQSSMKPSICNHYNTIVDYKEGVVTCLDCAIVTEERVCEPLPHQIHCTIIEDEDEAVWQQEEDEGQEQSSQDEDDDEDQEESSEDDDDAEAQDASQKEEDVDCSHYNTIVDYKEGVVTCLDCAIVTEERVCEPLPHQIHCTIIEDEDEAVWQQEEDEGQEQSSQDEDDDEDQEESSEYDDDASQKEEDVDCSASDGS